MSILLICRDIELLTLNVLPTLLVVAYCELCTVAMLLFQSLRFNGFVRPFAEYGLLSCRHAQLASPTNLTLASHLDQRDIDETYI